MEQEQPLDPRVVRLVEEEVLRARHARALAPPARSWLNENTKWVLTSIALPLAAVLFSEWKASIAEKERTSRESIATADRNLERELSDARNNVTAMTALLPALSDSDPDRSGLALIVLEQLQLAQRGKDQRIATLAAAVQTRIDQLRNSNNAADRAKAWRQQEALSEAGGTRPSDAPDPRQAAVPAAAAVQQAAQAKPRIVYIQFYAEGQRAQAAKAQQLLRSQGVGAPGIEKIAADSGARKGDRPARIYYFNADDLGAAKWLQDRLAASGLGNFEIARSSVPGVPSGQIELWWPKDPPSTGG